MNHPVKRYKPNDESKVRSSDIFDLYAGQPPIQTYSQFSSTFGGNSDLNINSDNQSGGDLDDSQLLQAHEIKKEPYDNGTDKDGGKCPSGNLYTSEGLQVSFKDLEQIFDNSDDTSNDETVRIVNIFHSLNV